MKKIIATFEGYLCNGLLILFVSAIFAQIISRQVFNYSISWTEELSVYLFVWFSFIGSSYAVKLAMHNRVVFQYAILPDKMVPFIKIISDIIWLAFSLYFFCLSYDFVFNKMNLFWRSQTLGVPMKYVYLVLPLSFFMISLRIVEIYIYKIFSYIKNKK